MKRTSADREIGIDLLGMRRWILERIGAIAGAGTALLLGVATSVTFTAVATAGPMWGPQGVIVAGSTASYRLASDGARGAYFLYNDYRFASVGLDLYLLRIGADGRGSQGWPTPGIPIEVGPGGDQQDEWLVVGDSSRVLVLWNEPRTPAMTLWLSSVEPDGSFSPGWPSTGRHIVPFTQTAQIDGRAIPDGEGGWWVAWGDGRNYNATGLDIYLSHLTRRGEPVDGIPSTGVRVNATAGDQGRFASEHFYPDGVGGVFLFWTDGFTPVPGVFMQRFGTDGVVGAGWPAAGRQIASFTPFYGLIAPPNAVFPGPSGNPLLYFLALGPHFTGLDQIFATYAVDSLGSPLPAWASGPRVFLGGEVPEIQRDGEMVSDGEGGVFATWMDMRNGGADVYAQHIQSTGELAPGWLVNGSPVVAGPGTDYQPHVVADGHGGVYVAFLHENGSTTAMLQHLGPDGAPLPGWPAAGLPVSPTGGGHSPLAACSDGQGGVIVSWMGGTGSTIFAQRWADDSPTAVEVSLVSSDARPDGVTLEWLAPSGGVPVADVQRRSRALADWTTLGRVQPDGAGRLTFVDRAVQPGDRFAYRLSYAGVMSSATWVDVPRATVFALSGARPNPAKASDLRVAFSLPHGEPAELAMYDVSGRRVAARQVSAHGAGSHVVRLAEGARVAPGLYWLRLTQGAQQTTSRVVVAE